VCSVEGGIPRPSIQRDGGGAHWNRTERRNRGNDRGSAYRGAQCRDGMLPARHDRRTDVRGPTRKTSAKPTSSPAPTRCCSTRSTGTAAKATESRSGARPRPCRRASGGRHDRDPGGRGSTEIRGSTPRKANCPCTSADDVERGQGEGGSASHPRCRTADAACTAEARQALRGGTRTLSSTGATWRSEERR